MTKATGKYGEVVPAYREKADPGSLKKNPNILNKTTKIWHKGREGVKRKARKGRANKTDDKVSESGVLIKAIKVWDKINWDEIPLYIA